MILYVAVYSHDTMNRLDIRDIISIKDFGRDQLEIVFTEADYISKLSYEERSSLCRGKILGYAFYEPSTRTRLSFEAAMASVGGSSLGFSNTATASTQKGESLADTIRIMAGYVDVVILRHPLDGSSRFAAEISDKPIINAASGTEEHPTQALLDIYTIKKEKGTVDGLSIGIIGDLKHGRTVYSLLYALIHYDVKVYLISPESLKIRPESIFELGKSISFTEITDIEECIDELDVLYVTRIQRERFADQEEYEKMRGSYVVGLDIVGRMKKDAIIMHPLPRLDEISPDVDGTSHARYFEQARYGKDIRAALLHLLLADSS